MSSAFRVRTLARVAGPLRRGFATSLARGKDTQGLKKLYNSADEAVADIPSGSTILSGGGVFSIFLRFLCSSQQSYSIDHEPNY